MPQSNTTTSTTKLATMSAKDIFRHAFHHAQLTKPPDDYRFSNAYHEYLDELHDALPTDHHTLVTMLLLYGIPMEEGFFICEHYPLLAKQINSTLAAGLGPFDPRLRHAHHFGRSLVIRLTQAAMDGRDVPNLASAIPKAEKQTCIHRWTQIRNQEWTAYLVNGDRHTNTPKEQARGAAKTRART